MPSVVAGYLTVADKLIHTLEESLDTLSKGGNEAQVWKHSEQNSRTSLHASVLGHGAQEGSAMHAPERRQLAATPASWQLVSPS